ncbi:EF-hand domain-containing protein [Acidomonas methanolica]|uniref:EF-hand domain-containing protein n=1 Tax=Acidomonas methanolica TaxID=437 RepID=UPI002119F376|nr:EF-hand domain-containing protein [Acidomonas methanolica]MCQ9156854.1 EF-hand domain-containing protein [Acidomonas methanolica]
MPPGRTGREFSGLSEVLRVLLLALSFVGPVNALAVLVSELAEAALSEAAQARDERTTGSERRAESFRAADTNSDGCVSQGEFEAFARAYLTRASGFRALMFRSLSPKEQKARLDRKFSEMDAAHNGRVTLDEWHPES